MVKRRFPTHGHEHFKLLKSIFLESFYFPASNLSVAGRDIAFTTVDLTIYLAINTHELTRPAPDWPHSAVGRGHRATVI